MWYGHSRVENKLQARARDQVGSVYTDSSKTAFEKTWPDDGPDQVFIKMFA